MEKKRRFTQSTQNMVEIWPTLFSQKPFSCELKKTLSAKRKKTKKKNIKISIKLACKCVVSTCWMEERLSVVKWRQTKWDGKGWIQKEEEENGQRAKRDKTRGYQMATTNRGFVSQQGHAEHCKDNGGMHKAEQINRLSQKIMRRNYFSSRCCLGV